MIGERTPVQRVLLVDDYASILNAWERDLVRAGKTVAKATTRAEAIELAARMRPQLAIVDLFLDREHGIDVLTDLKGVDDAMFVVIVSAHMSTANAVHAMRSGASSCEDKPVSCRRIVELAETGFAADIGLDDLDRLSLDELEWQHISRALHDCGNNITRAAEQLGMYRNTLRRKLEKRGLNTTDARALFARRS